MNTLKKNFKNLMRKNSTARKWDEKKNSNKNYIVFIKKKTTKTNIVHIKAATTVLTKTILNIYHTAKKERENKNFKKVVMS